MSTKEPQMYVACGQCQDAGMEFRAKWFDVTEEIDPKTLCLFPSANHDRMVVLDSDGLGGRNI